MISPTNFEKPRTLLSSPPPAPTTSLFGLRVIVSPYMPENAIGLIHPDGRIEVVHMDETDQPFSETVHSFNETNQPFSETMG